MPPSDLAAVAYLLKDPVTARGYSIVIGPRRVQVAAPVHLPIASDGDCAYAG